MVEREAFTRQEFYDLVWSTAMTKLAKRFGMSDVGLRKICVKHAVPTPPAGYWAKLQHGKKVRKVPMPAAAAGIVAGNYLDLDVASPEQFVKTGETRPVFQRCDGIILAIPLLQHGLPDSIFGGLSDGNIPGVEVAIADDADLTDR